ncbi:MAG: hypothetical protein KC636_29005, partial [Myxococcales bacterium]|nr:hypothetical protein [Myxococcales bacterium]
MQRPDPPTRAQLRRLSEVMKKQRIPGRVQVGLALSCPVAWDSMRPVADGVRHCQRCDADVHDLTGLTKAALVARVLEHRASLCGQVVAREDGRVVFGECQEPSRVMRGRIVVRP